MHEQFLCFLEIANNSMQILLNVVHSIIDAHFQTVNKVHKKKKYMFRKIFPPHALPNHPPQQKMAAFYTYVYQALHICSDPSNLSKKLHYFKSLALSQSYNPSIIQKALNKFKKPKHSVCHPDPCLNPVLLPFCSSISFKISKILSCFCFKISFRHPKKIIFSSPKDPIPIENWSGIYFIPCSFCNLD